MFTAFTKKENGFEMIVLSDEAQHITVEILPECGALLHSFKIKHNDIETDVIEKYANKEDFNENQAGKGFRGAKLSPFACRLKNGKFKLREKEYTLEKFYLGDHAMHGLLYDAFFSTAELNAGDDYACAKMMYSYQGDDPGYPFPYSCVVEYTLRKGNELSIATTLQNQSEEAIPVSDGWHPYFTFGKNINDLQMEFQTGTKLAFDDSMIPTGEEKGYEDFVAIKNIGVQKFDDCFRLNFEACQPMVVLRDKTLRLQVEIIPAKTYPFLQIYTPQERQSIALENLSAAPDCFNNGIGLQVLAPGGKTSFNTVYRLVSF